MIYADTGINWEFLYEVLFEDEDILVLRDMGRYHRFDKERMFAGKVDKYIEIHGDLAYIADRKKLVEVQ